VSRTNEEPNSYLANDLIAQLGNIELPVMIPFNNAELRNDDNSPYGLAFNIIGEIIYALILNSIPGYFSSEDIDEETGLPKKLGKGKRIFYTRNTGLCNICMLGNFDVCTSDEYLALSGYDGRIVIVID